VSEASPPAQGHSLRALLWLNFFVADVQTGLGPFLAAYLASSGWDPGRVGYALTFGGLVTVAMQTPAGAMIDGVHHKRVVLVSNLAVMVAGAVLLMGESVP
jgi:MFS family permease